ncbi:MAG: hypothetical protein P4L91_06615 [Burkholderiaceae bacterium]|nr:hypothetical protein [Burkholderiaceae bacterium]
MNLGFFPDFKGSDSVLLSGDPAEITFLSRQLRQFVLSGDALLQVHNFVDVSPQYPAQLLASKLGQGMDFAYIWPCSPDEFETIQPKLESLAMSSFGHQYFDLANSRARLIVSVGEYDKSWWQAHS